MKICIQITMAEEARPFIELLGFKQSDPLETPIPHNLYQTKIDNKEVSLIVNGRFSENVSYVGTEFASLISQSVLSFIKPDLLINAGTSGGKSTHGLNIGDVTICKKVYFHDHRISIPGYNEYFKGDFAPSDKYFNILSEIKNLIPVIVSTGNSFEMNESDNNSIIELKSSVKEMELAGIAQVASFYNSSWIGIKSITDIIDNDNKPTSDQFFENLNLACLNLSKSLKEIIEFL